MIKSLYTIGNVLSGNEAYAEYFQPWSNPFPKSNNTKIIVVNVENKKFKSISEFDYKKNSTKEILYRKPAGSNSDKFITPTIPYTDKDKLTRRLRSTMKGLIQKGISILEENELPKVEVSIRGYKLNADYNYVITFKIDDKWLGEINDFVELVNQEAYEKYYKKEKGTSKASNQVCAVTGNKGEVWGFVDILGFTVDIASFSRNGFNMNEAYKMFPVSPEAVKKLEGAVRIIFENDYTLIKDTKFFLIPRFLHVDEKTIEEIIEAFLQKSSNRSSLETFGRSIINKETIINDIIEEEKLSKKGVYYDIFFYQRKKKQLAIKLHLLDVLPSRMKEIFDAKKRIENKYELLNRVYFKPKNKKTNEAPKKFEINFGGFYEKNMPPMYGIKDYFSQKMKTDIVFHPYFFKVLEAVFYGNALNNETILKAFMEKIVTAFKNTKENPNDFGRHIKTSFTIYQFFNELNLFNSSTMEENTVRNNEPVSLELDGFIEQHIDFFPENEPVKKGAFYLGCLTEKMLSIQRSYYKFDKPYQEPFLKNLRNLNFDVKELLAIANKLNTFHKYQSILKSYDFREITALQEKAEKYLIAPTNLSRTELSFCFTLGMAMQREFVKKAIQNRKLQTTSK